MPPFNGPLLVTTPEEVEFLQTLLVQPEWSGYPVSHELLRKVERVLASDPRFRKPVK